MKLTATISIVVLLVATATSAPLSEDDRAEAEATATATTVQTTTPPPARHPPSSRQRPITDEDEQTSVDTQRLQQTAQNVSESSLESWQAATILLTHIETVILAGYEVPPEPPCFQEERDPSTYEHPHPDTNFQNSLTKDYDSLLMYIDYFSRVAESNSKLTKLAPETNSSVNTTAPPEVVYAIEFGDFNNTVNVLQGYMEELLTVLDPSVLNKQNEDTAPTLAENCYLTCYGQQVGVLRDYLTLVYYHIPGDISGLLDSTKD